MDLEVAGADRHLEPVPVPPGLRRARAPPRTRSARRSAGHGARAGARPLDASAATPDAPAPPATAAAARPAGPGSATTTRPSCSSSTPGAVPARPSETAPSGSDACLRHARGEVGIRPTEPLGDAHVRRSRSHARAPRRRRARRPVAARDQLDRPVVVRRPEAAGARRRGPRRAPRASARSSSSARSPTIDDPGGLEPELERARAARKGPFTSRRSPRTSSLPVTTTTARGAVGHYGRDDPDALRRHDDDRRARRDASTVLRSPSARGRSPAPNWSQSRLRDEPLRLPSLERALEQELARRRRRRERQPGVAADRVQHEVDRLGGRAAAGGGSPHRRGAGRRSRRRRRRRLSGRLGVAGRRTARRRSRAPSRRRSRRARRRRSSTRRSARRAPVARRVARDQRLVGRGRSASCTRRRRAAPSSPRYSAYVRRKPLTYVSRRAGARTARPRAPAGTSPGSSCRASAAGESIPCRSRASRRLFPISNTEHDCTHGHAVRAVTTCQRFARRLGAPVGVACFDEADGRVTRTARVEPGRDDVSPAPAPARSRRRSRARPSARSRSAGHAEETADRRGARAAVAPERSLVVEPAAPGERDRQEREHEAAPDARAPPRRSRPPRRSGPPPPRREDAQREQAEEHRR